MVSPWQRMFDVRPARVLLATKSIHSGAAGMRLSGLSLRAKVYWSFLIVVAIFSVQMGYSVLTLGTLSRLQEASSTAAQDAVAVEAVQTRVAGVSQLLGDAVINGRFDE